MVSASPGSAFPMTYGGRLEHGGGGGSSNTYPYAASDGERSDSYLSMHACMHAFSRLCSIGNGSFRFKLR